MGAGLLLMAVLTGQPPAGWQDAAVGMLMNAGRGSADAPVATQTLAANEILLELAAHGVEMTPADTATISVAVAGRGSSQAAAQAEHDATVRRVRAAAQAAGVSPNDVDPSTDRMIDLDVFDVAEPPPPEAEPQAPPASSGEASAAPLPPLVRDRIEPPRLRPSVRTILRITLRNPARVDSLIQAVESAGGDVTGQTEYSLTDDAPARRAARASALAKARADAEAYASVMNMRVVRVARITERTGFDVIGMMFGALAGGSPSQMRASFEPSGGQVPTNVFIGADFILAPR